jgi:hypothetical protein
MPKNNTYLSDFTQFRSFQHDIHELLYIQNSTT